MSYDFDLFTIGAGSGGVRASRIAAQAGGKVAIAEEFRPGGTCVIRGCVPKKFMVYASEFRKSFKDAAGFGYTIGDVSYDHPSFIKSLGAEVERLSGLYAKGLKGAGVELFRERAEVVDAHTVKLADGRTFTAERILIAVGGTPFTPTDIDGHEHIITSDDIFEIEQLPKSIVIGGGGYIAVEFAHIFAGLGVETHLVYRSDTVLRGFDEEVREVVQEGLKASGVNVITNTIFEKIVESDSDYRFEVPLTNGTTLKADLIVGAMGRLPYTKGLGLENAGVELDSKGAIKVDEWSRSNVPSIWAVGDVTDRVNLTPVAIREGHAFADTEFGGKAHHFDHDKIATAVFTQPPVGTVGLSEEQARAEHGEIDIYKSRFKPMKNALSGDQTRVLMKLVVRASDQVVLGCHIVGPDSPEIIQAVGIAVKMNATKQDFDNTCALHPSLAEELVTMRNKFVPDQ